MLKGETPRAQFGELSRPQFALPVDIETAFASPKYVSDGRTGRILGLRCSSGLLFFQFRAHSLVIGLVVGPLL